MIKYCCNCPCPFGSDEEPCWGDVFVVDEDLIYDEDGEIIDSSWVHTCEGHCEITSTGGKYIPCPEDKLDTLRSSDEECLREFLKPR
jgi:hypothetical protein